MAKENSEYLQPAGQPYSLEAEQSLLGCLLVDPSCLPLIQSGGFKAEYLYVPQQRSSPRAKIPTGTPQINI